MTTGTTPKGYPYPNGDDPISNGDNVIKDLATAVDTNLGRMAAGTVDVNIATANTTGSVVVVFPVGRFTASPAVALGTGTSAPQSTSPGYTIGGSLTQFTCIVWCNAVASRRIGWIAVQY